MWIIRLNLNPVLGENNFDNCFFLLDASFIILVTSKPFSLCSPPLFPHLLLSTILQPQAQTPLPYKGKASSVHVRFLLAHTPTGDK